MPITIKEVAERARVSPMTVSRVFSPRHGFPIAEATRIRVQATARELGYKPNKLARALATGQTRIVTMHVPVMNPYYAEIVGKIHSLLLESRYEMIMLIDPGKRDQQDLLSFPTDGVIAIDLPHMPQAQNEAASPIEQTPPMVMLGTHKPDAADYVLVDVYDGALCAVHHLAQQGARRIAYIMPGYSDYAGEGRRDGYFDAVRQLGMDPWIYTISNEGREVTRREMASQIHPGNVPDAILCYNDDCAIGLLGMLRDKGISVPGDVMVCGCDGLADTDYLATPLTTIAHPLDEMCKAGWRALLGRLSGNDIAPVHQLLKPSLVVRESSRRR